MDEGDLQDEDPAAMKVVVVGGSLTGLMHGLTLSRLGHEVYILEERTPGPNSYGSGIRVGPRLRKFMKTHGLDNPEYTVPYEASRLHITSKWSRWWTFLIRVPAEYTRWDIVYNRILAAFANSESKQSFHENGRKTASKTAYLTGKRVIEVQHNGSASHLKVLFSDVASGKSESLHADLVIAADGSNSRVAELVSDRRKAKKYAGYVAWRGTVSVNKLSPQTLAFFEKHNNLFWGAGQSFNLYRIPSLTGSLDLSEQLVNFVWYSNAAEGSSELKDIMTDNDGHFRRTMVPLGKVRPMIWERQQIPYIAQSNPVSEVMKSIDEPFVQVINEYCAPQACFFGGKLLLTGDALCLSRPHLGLSTDQAASHALLLEKALRGSISLDEWERRVLSQAHTRWIASRVLGNLYQFGILSGFLSGLQYLWISCRYSLQAWWCGYKELI